MTAAAFCINDAIGPFGSQSFFWPYVTSTANTRTLLFEYNGVCRRASAYSSSECYPYDASPGPIVADNEYLNWYRQQLASFDGGLAMAGTVLAAMGCLIVPLTLHRAVTMVYCGGPEATRWFYNWTSRALLGVALAQLLGTLLVFAAFFRLSELLRATRDGPLWLPAFFREPRDVSLRASPGCARRVCHGFRTLPVRGP